jgi:hypothetical protein
MLMIVVYTCHNGGGATVPSVSSKQPGLASASATISATCFDMPSMLPAFQSVFVSHTCISKWYDNSVYSMSFDIAAVIATVATLH